MPEAKCQSCGAELPANAKFCSECGTPVASGDTVVAEVPPPEPAPAPVEPQVAERRFFGVPPSSVLFLLIVLGVVAAIGLLAAGAWPWALIILGLTGFVATALVTQVRRLPGETGTVTKASLKGLDSVRGRGRAVVETVAAHGNARMELARLRRETSPLVIERRERVRELGAAAYADDEDAVKDLKERIKQIDDEVQAKEAEMAKVTIDAQERIGRAKLEVQPTRVETPDPGAEATRD